MSPSQLKLFDVGLWLVPMVVLWTVVAILWALFRALRSNPAGVGRFIRDRYMVVDPRTAGLFRIALGFVLVLDAIRHSAEARLLYSNDGVLTNDLHLWQPSSNYEFSIFHAFSTLAEVRVCFALGILAHLLLLIGYRSRLFAFLSFLFVTSMDTRIPLVENGGYVVVNLACLWATCLPVGQRFSLDAWLRSWRARRETTVAELNDRTDFTGEERPFVSAIGLIITFNLAAVYFWNVVNKGGEIWRQGHTIHYVLWLNRMVTGLAVLLRQITPDWLLRPIDWGTLCIEACLCVLIVSPKAKRYTRPLAILGMIALHSVLGLMMRLGPFSWFLIACSTLLLTKLQWEDLARLYEKRSPGRWQVGIRKDSGLGITWSRVLRRLDGLERLGFVEREDEDAPVLSVRASGSDTWTTEPRELFAELGEALPFGKYWWPVVRVASFGLVERVLIRILTRPAPVERFFGLVRDDAAEEEHPAVASPSFSDFFPRLARVWSWVKWTLREPLFFGYLGLTALNQMYLENKCIPTVMKWDDNEWYKDTLAKVIRPTINYPRIFQGWGMFAPNPIQEDGILAIDAYTIDGRRIDPYNGGGPPQLDLTKAQGLGISQLRQDYGNRIRLDGNQRYRDGIQNWLSKYQEQTGNPNDQIVAFDVYWLRDKCPPLGSKQPYKNDLVALYTWRKPGFTPAPGAIPIPPPPKVRSADKWEDGAPTAPPKK